MHLPLAGQLVAPPPSDPVALNRLVLLDCAYNNEWKADGNGTPRRFHYVWDDTANSGYSQLAAIIGRTGAVVDTLNVPPTADALANASVYIIVDPDTPKENPHPRYVSTADAVVIGKWVSEGGTLVLFGNDKGNAEFEHFNKLAERFGIHFNEDSHNRVTGQQYETGTFSQFPQHPLFAGVRRIFIKEYSSLQLQKPAQPVFQASADGPVVMAVSRVGKGLVFALGDPWLYNEYMDARRLPQGYDNTRAAGNLFRWLLAGCGLSCDRHTLCWHGVGGLSCDRHVQTAGQECETKRSSAISDIRYPISLSHAQRSSIMKTLVTVLAILVVIPSLLLAQGTIRGVVSDSTSGDVLVGANVLVKGTALGAATDLYGKFRIPNISAGTRTLRIAYIGYKSREIPVVIADGEEALINVRLLPDVIEGQEVLVTAQARGQEAAINQQLTSNTIVNVISEEKIKELPDANAAEAIGRLPGVSLIRSGGEANKVILRGMSDKFTAFTIDGIRIPSTDADARGVDLSTFSQGTLAGVELFKALTPDKDADAIAGSINLVTRKAPSVRQIRVDAKGAYNKLTKNFGQYDFTGKYGERFFDDILGVQVNANLEQRDRSNEQYTLSLDGTLRNFTDYMISDFTLGYVDETRKRGGVGLLLDINTPDSGSIRINNLFNQTDRDYITYNRDYPNGGERVYYTAWDREQKINTFNSSIRGDNYLFDMNINWGLSFAQSQSNYPYNYRMQFSEPPSNGVSGMRAIPEDIWKGPVEKFIPYAYNNFGMSSLDTAVYSTEKNRDIERTAFLDLSRKYTLGDMMSGEIKAGGKFRYRSTVQGVDQPAGAILPRVLSAELPCSRRDHSAQEPVREPGLPTCSGPATWCC